MKAQEGLLSGSCKECYVKKKNKRETVFGIPILFWVLATTATHFSATPFWRIAQISSERKVVLAQATDIYLRTCLLNPLACFGVTKTTFSHKMWLMKLNW